MRIACPACAAAYEVPDRLLAGPARTLRCSRCGTDFALPQAEAPAEPVAVAPPPAAEPLPPPPEQPPEPPPRPLAAPVMPPATPRPAPHVSRDLALTPDTPSPALARAWVASVVVVAAAVIGFFAFHAKVMEVWPASTRLFAALGLA